MEGSSTDSATGMSNMDNDWQRPAKSRNLCRRHAPAETCKANWFDRGPNGFGNGHLVFYPLVEGPVSDEKRKWGWCGRSGAGAMGNGFTFREIWWRDQQLQLRRDLHPWRRDAGEVKLAGSGLEWRTDRSRQ